MKIVVDRLLCEGNGNCTREAPELLAVDNEDQLYLLKETFGEEYREKAEAAVSVCPKHALSLEE